MFPKLLAVAASLTIAISVTASAQGGGIEVKDAWARATPGKAETAAAYVTILSATPDRLTGVSTPAAEKAELHLMSMDGGVMKMRPVDGIDLPAGQAVTLKPGGYHIMMSGLAQPLRAGQSFPMTLSFENGGRREVTVTVEKAGAMGPNGGPNGHGGGMDMPMPMRH